MKCFVRGGRTIELYNFGEAKQRSFFPKVYQHSAEEHMTVTGMYTYSTRAVVLKSRNLEVAGQHALAASCHSARYANLS